MIYNNSDRFTKGTFSKKLKQYIYITGFCIATMCVGCNSNSMSDCFPEDNFGLKKISADGRCYLNDGNSYVNSTMVFKNQNGQFMEFEVGEIENDTRIETAFFECDNDFVSIDHFLESSELNLFNSNFVIRLSLRKTLTNSFGFADNNCVSEIFEIQITENPNNSFSQMVVETIQNSCFSSSSLDHFEFMDTAINNGVTFNKVYTNQVNSNFIDLIKFYYSKEKGLVGINDTSGNLWVLEE